MISARRSHRVSFSRTVATAGVLLLASACSSKDPEHAGTSSQSGSGGESSDGSKPGGTGGTSHVTTGGSASGGTHASGSGGTHASAGGSTSTSGSGGTASSDAGGSSSTGGSGSSPAGVPPSNGPAACGCAQGQVCVQWKTIDRIDRECFELPAQCANLLEPTSTQALCTCFNPCGPANAGASCFDKNRGASLTWGPENLRCQAMTP